ncbi:MAG: hypothetical protein WAL41_06860 [Mycobacterium sp.]
MTKRPEHGFVGAARRLAIVTLLTGLVVALLGCLAPMSSASTLLHPQTRVAAAEHPAGHLVGPHSSVLAVQGRERTPNYDQSATGSSVAAEGEGLLNLSAEDSWGNPSSLEDHFLRHGADFGATSADQYANDASQFLQQALKDGYPVKVDADGVIRVYDPETNTFGAYNANGTTRTFFKPTNGAAYWASQPGSTP